MTINDVRMRAVDFERSAELNDKAVRAQRKAAGRGERLRAFGRASDVYAVPAISWRKFEQLMRDRSVTVVEDLPPETIRKWARRLGLLSFHDSLRFQPESEVEIPGSQPREPVVARTQLRPRPPLPVGSAQRPPSFRARPVRDLASETGARVPNRADLLGLLLRHKRLIWTVAILLSLGGITTYLVLHE